MDKMATKQIGLNFDRANKQQVCTTVEKKATNMYNSINKEHVYATVQINNRSAQQCKKKSTIVEKNPTRMYNSKNKQQVCTTV